MPPSQGVVHQSRWLCFLPTLSQASVLVALLAATFAPECSRAEGIQTGFKNRYYQASGYQGSRTLEHNVTGHFYEYVEATWSQSVAIDDEGRIWIADKTYHVVVLVYKSDRYLDWAAFYTAYAGERGVASHFDGKRSRARFDSPSGIAVATVDGSLHIYVADTNNHCIRKLNYDNGRTTTIAGYAQKPGLQDGPGRESRFRSPMSLGIDSSGTMLFALDNGRRIRYVQLTQTIPLVITLADGACRAVSRWTVHATVSLRKVGCHTDWNAQRAGDTSVEVYTWSWICKGHNSTCGPRYFPAVNDTSDARMSQPKLKMIPSAAPAQVQLL